MPDPALCRHLHCYSSICRHLPLPLPLKLALRTLKFYHIPGMPGAVVRYTQFALVCYLNKFYFGLLAY
jgi:hypothetical protein